MLNLLLLMPFFMGYEKTLSKELSNDYNVTLVNSDICDNEILADYRKCSKIHWAFRHLSSRLIKKEKEKILEQYDYTIIKKIIQDKNHYQVVFCINCGYVSERLIRLLKTNNPNATCYYYVWDDKKNLFFNKHIYLFDKVFSYNIDDCKANHWKYLPMFVQGQYKGHKSVDLYDIAFIGTAHSDRIEIAEKLIEKYSDTYNVFVYLYDKVKKGIRYIYNKPLTYEEYLEILSSSKAILDITADVQTGPTTRVFDALLTKTKVITTNNNIKKYPVCSANVLFVQRDTLEIPEEFLMAEYRETKYDALTVKRWVEKINLNGG